MIEHVTKLKHELARDLKAALENYSKDPEAKAATEKALQALFKNMEIINNIVCSVLETAIANKGLLQIMTTWVEDQGKLANATKGRLDVFGGPKV